MIRLINVARNLVDSCAGRMPEDSSDSVSVEAIHVLRIHEALLKTRDEEATESFLVDVEKKIAASKWVSPDSVLFCTEWREEIKKLAGRAADRLRWTHDTDQRRSETRQVLVDLVALVMHAARSKQLEDALPY